MWDEFIPKPTTVKYISVMCMHWSTITRSSLTTVSADESHGEPMKHEMSYTEGGFQLLFLCDLWLQLWIEFGNYANPKAPAKKKKKETRAVAYTCIPSFPAHFLYFCVFSRRFLGHNHTGSDHQATDVGRHSSLEPDLSRTRHE